MFTAGPTGRLFTFFTNRPLRILYFDDSSAAKLSTGASDNTQGLLAKGWVGNNTAVDDWKRLVKFCEIGEKVGIDGYVRLEMSL